MSLELKREMRGGVAGAVSLLNELMGMGEISYGWSMAKKVEARMLGNGAYKRRETEPSEME